MRKVILNIISVWLLLVVYGNSALYANLQKDSIPNIIKVWEINSEYSFVDSLSIDTALTDMLKLLPKNNSEISPVSLGNYGLPFFINTHDVHLNVKNPFIENLKGYFLSFDNQKYYNTRKPISQIDYFNIGSKNSKSQILKVLHTQNITPEFNAGFRVMMNNSLGDYKNQEVKNNSFGVWSSYQNKNYELFTSFNYNKFKIHENGGFSNDSVFESGSFDDSRFIEVNLNSAKSVNYYNDFSLSQEISLKKVNQKRDSVSLSSQNSGFKILHKAKWIRSARMYEDSDPLTGFYQTIYLDSVITLDTSSYSTIYNSLLLKWTSKKNSFLFESGAFNSVDRYFGFDNDSSMVDYGVLFAANTSDSKKLSLSGNSKFFLIGENIGDYKIDVNLKIKLRNDSIAPYIGFKLFLENDNPTVFMNTYSSNNFHWDNEFNSMTTNRLEAFVKLPSINTHLLVKGGAFGNYIYFNEDAMPSQSSNSISVLSIELKNTIRLNKFNYSSILLYQKSDNKEIIPLPEFSCTGSFSFEDFMFKKALHAGIGVDVSYYTAYYSPAYMPALGVFYNQSEKEIGNYPFVDIYIKAKIKNLRLLFKYQHINENLLTSKYFTTLHYAAPPRRFSFGLSWMFYN